MNVAKRPKFWKRGVHYFRRGSNNFLWFYIFVARARARSQHMFFNVWLEHYARKLRVCPLCETLYDLRDEHRVSFPRGDRFVTNNYRNGICTFVSKLMYVHLHVSNISRKIQMSNIVRESMYVVYTYIGCFRNHGGMILRLKISHVRKE